MKRTIVICLSLLLVLILQGCAASKDYMPAPEATTPPSPTEPAPPTLAIEPSSPADWAAELIETPPPAKYEDWENDYVIPNSDEEYLVINENRLVNTAENSLLTFSLKVDTASYRNVVRYIESGSLPPVDAVRVEEMINYFNYEQPLELNDTPFSIYTELGPSPFSILTLFRTSLKIPTRRPLWLGSPRSAKNTSTG